MREEKLRRLVVLDLLHARIEFRPIGLVCQGAGFLEQLIELGVAPFRRVAVARFASRATSQEEEIVRVAVVPGPTILAGDLLASGEALAILAPLIGDELGVDADLGEVGLHHLADALAVGIVRPRHRHVPEIDVERRLDAGRGQHRLRLLLIEGHVRNLVVEGPQGGRDQRRRLRPRAEIDVLDDRVAIDRHRQSLTNLLLVERRLHAR